MSKLASPRRASRKRRPLDARRGNVASFSCLETTGLTFLLGACCESEEEKAELRKRAAYGLAKVQADEMDAKSAAYIRENDRKCKEILARCIEKTRQELLANPDEIRYLTYAERRLHRVSHPDPPVRRRKKKAPAKRRTVKKR